MQPAKQYLAILTTDGGIQLDSSDEHFLNPNVSTMGIVQPGSNVKVKRLVHCSKQYSEMVSTDAGRRKDSSDEQAEKTDSPRPAV
jgi:hypothetical protein